MSSEHKSSGRRKSTGANQQSAVYHISFRWSVPDSDTKVPPH